MKIQIEKKPYDNFTIHTKKTFELKDNAVTIVCGCNGYGKSTVLSQIKNNIHATDLTAIYGNPFAIGMGALDKLKDNLLIDYNKDYLPPAKDMIKAKLLSFVRSNGEDLSIRLADTLLIFKDALEKKLLNNKKIFILIDDADAGTSIDVITEIKDIIALIYNDCIQNHLSFYIVLTANSYELTHFDNIDFVCIDANTFKEKTFKSYETYKKFVLKTRSIKDKRYENEEKTIE